MVVNWQSSPFAVPLLVGAVILIISAFLVLRRSKTLTDTYLAIANILMAVFSGAYGLELLQTTFEGVFFWQRVGLTGGVSTPVILLLLLITYYGPESMLSGINHLILLTIPLISIGLSWTSQYHELLYQNPHIEQVGSIFMFDYVPGWWHWVTIIYIFIIVIISVAYLLSSFSKRKGAFRNQVITLLVGISLPTLTYGFFWIVELLKLPIPKFSWQAYAFIITGLIVTYSLHNTDVFQISPVAYDAIIKNIEDVIVVLDGHNRVIDINPAAIRILNWERLAVIGKNFEELLPGSELEGLLPYLNTSEAQGEIEFRDYSLELKITSFTYQLQSNVGRLIVMKNITQRVEAERARRELAAQEERRRLARDLHDSMTQSLHSLVLSTETARHLYDDDQLDKLETSLDMLNDSARQALREMRLLCYELQLTPDDQVDWFSILQARLEAVESRMGIAAEFQLENRNFISEEYEREFFYILTEALNNTLKHSRADIISVHIHATSSEISLSISDNGIGFDPKMVDQKGMGLTNIQERVQRLGGVVEVDSAPGSGTCIQVRINPVNSD